MSTLTLEQFLAYVAGSILDEYEVYDCPDHIYRSVLCIVRHHYEQAGFDYNTIKPDPYFEWFCRVMETVVEKIDYLKQQPTRI